MRIQVADILTGLGLRRMLPANQCGATCIIPGRSPTRNSGNTKIPKLWPISCKREWVPLYRDQATTPMLSDLSCEHVIRHESSNDTSAALVVPYSGDMVE